MELDDMHRVKKIVGHLNEEAKVMIEAAQAMGDIRESFHMSVYKMEQ